MGTMMVTANLCAVFVLATVLTVCLGKCGGLKGPLLPPTHRLAVRVEPGPNLPPLTHQLVKPLQSRRKPAASCTVDECIMEVGGASYSMQVLDTVTKNAYDALTQCQSLYGSGALLPEAATPSDLAAILALSQAGAGKQTKRVWIGARFDESTTSFTYASGNTVNELLWQQGRPVNSLSAQCVIAMGTVIMDRPCGGNGWTRNTVCAVPAAAPGCPPDWDSLPSSGRCYKYFSTTGSNMKDAEAECRTHGAQAVTPRTPGEVAMVDALRGKANIEAPSRNLTIEVLSSRNLVTVAVDGTTVYTKKARGIHVVEMDQGTGAVLEGRVFDTYSSNANAKRLVQFVNETVEDGRLLVFSIQDDGAWQLGNDAKMFLRGMGSTSIHNGVHGYRNHWAFVVHKGASSGLGEKRGRNKANKNGYKIHSDPVTLTVEVPLRPTKAEVWIGLHQDMGGDSDAWLWSDGTDASGDNNWNTGEPNGQNSTENCVVLDEDVKFNDIPCRKINPSVICEKRPACKSNCHGYKSRSQ